MNTNCLEKCMNEGQHENECEIRIVKGRNRADRREKFLGFWEPLRGAWVGILDIPVPNPPGGGGGVSARIYVLKQSFAKFYVFKPYGSIYALEGKPLAHLFRMRTQEICHMPAARAGRRRVFFLAARVELPHNFEPEILESGTWNPEISYKSSKLSISGRSELAAQKFDLHGFNTWKISLWVDGVLVREDHKVSVLYRCCLGAPKAPTMDTHNGSPAPMVPSR